MIKNQKQAALTKSRLDDLNKAKESFLKKGLDKNSAVYQLGIDSLDSLISDLQKEVNEYEGFTNGNLHCWESKYLSNVADILIGARLARKMSQKELADLLEIKEQQIQRYEIANYETASWPRIVEVAAALGLKLKFERIIIINTQEEFQYPEDMTPEQVNFASIDIQKSKSLL